MRARCLVAVVAAPLLLGGPTAAAQTIPSSTPPAAAASPWVEAIGATPGLAAWWRLDERDGAVAADRAGGHDGTYAAGVRLGATGLVADDPDPAIGLDAQGDAFVDIGDELDFPGLTPFSVEAWIAPGAYQSPYPRILQKDGPDANGNRQGYLVYLNQQTGNLGFERWRDGKADVVTTQQPIVLDRPTYVVATFDGSAMRLYVDGAQVAEAPAVQELADNPFGMRLGARSDGQSPYFGILDEVAVYETALDADTVAAHYAAGAAGGPVTLSPFAAGAATPAVAERPAPTPVATVAAPTAASASSPVSEQTIIGPPAPAPGGVAEATTAATAGAVATETSVPAEPAIATEAPAVSTVGPAAPTPTAAAAAATAAVPATTTDEVNFRAGPSTDTVIISTLPAGTAVEATGKVVDGFVQVVFEGRRGWVAADYLVYPEQ